MSASRPSPASSVPLEPKRLVEGMALSMRYELSLSLMPSCCVRL